MGKFTIEKWKCDRCGEVKDKRPSSGGSAWEVELVQSYPDGPGARHVWKEMCPRCNAEVGRLYETLLYTPPTPEPPHA